MESLLLAYCALFLDHFEIEVRPSRISGRPLLIQGWRKLLFDSKVLEKQLMIREKLGELGLEIRF